MRRVVVLCPCGFNVEEDEVHHHGMRMIMKINVGCAMWDVGHSTRCSIVVRWLLKMAMVDESEKKMVGWRVEEGVGWITLDRGGRGNALTPEGAQELVDAVEEAVSDGSVYAIVLTGVGKHFCTGMDLSSSGQSKMAAATSSKSASKSAPKSASKLIDVFEVLARCPKPTIAFPNGSAYGGGIGLLFACDFRIGVGTDVISFKEVRRGLVPAMISTYVVPVLGVATSKQLMLTGSALDFAALAGRGGMTAVADDREGARALLDVLLNELRLCGPRAMAATKDLIHKVCEVNHSDAMGLAQAVFVDSLSSPEVRHGLSAFRSKVDPDWTLFRLSTSQSSKL